MLENSTGYLSDGIRCAGKDSKLYEEPSFIPPPSQGRSIIVAGKLLDTVVSVGIGPGEGELRCDRDPRPQHAEENLAEGARPDQDRGRGKETANTRWCTESKNLAAQVLVLGSESNRICISERSTPLQSW